MINVSSLINITNYVKSRREKFGISTRESTLANRKNCIQKHTINTNLVKLGVHNSVSDELSLLGNKRTSSHFDLYYYIFVCD